MNQEEDSSATSKFQDRQTAGIIRIKDIINSTYVKESELKPNYVLVGSKKISRVNLIATVVDKSDSMNYKSLTLDDGTGNISLRFFDNPDLLDQLNIGDPVLVIAKPREFNSEKYLIPEIIKKIRNKKWIDVRKKALELTPQETAEAVVEQEEKVEETQEPLPAEKIINLIRQLDSGDGADFESIIQKSEISNAEEIINSLLTQGDIFEVKPGKLKVLE